MTALLAWRVAPLFAFQWLIRMQCGTFSAGQQIQAVACMQCCVLSCSAQSLLCEGSGSVRATQGLSWEYDRTPFPYGPQRWNYNNNNNAQLHAWKEKDEGGGGASSSKASKTLVEWLMKPSSKEQKQAPESSTGVFQTYENASLSLFPALWIHYQLLGCSPPPRAPWWIPDEGGKKEEVGVRGVKRERKKKKCLAPQRWSCAAASITPPLYSARGCACQNLWAGFQAPFSKSKSLTPIEL